MKEMVGGCCVCSDERGWPENPLVYCDGQNCTVAVHQACYGIVTVPTGPWYCRKCESQERSARVRCELCPSRDGALKKTDNQGWAHVVCALYIPEVRFGNVTTMEPIILQLIPPERYSKTCYICQEIGKGSRANVGACMQCNKSGCKQQFHVTCAQGLGLLCEEAGNYLDNVKYCGYCQHHYSKLKKGGNVKTIPPYKPITHETGSSDATSSPEKELEPANASAPTASSSSASSTAANLKMSSNPAANSSTIVAPSSSTSSSSSKQRKSSSTSKSGSSGSSASSSSAAPNVSGGAAGPGGASSNPTSSISSNSSSSKNSSSSSNSSKDKDKHGKSLSKVSSSSKSSSSGQDKEASSSSTSSSTREKSKSSKSTSKDSSGGGGGGGGGSGDHSGGTTNSNSALAFSKQNQMTRNLSGNNTSVLASSSSSSSAASSSATSSISGSTKDTLGQKFTTSNFTETVVVNSDSVFGTNDAPNPQQITGQTSSSAPATKSSSSSSSIAKKRKADSAKQSSSSSSTSSSGLSANSASNSGNLDPIEFNKDIIKDVSVTLIPLPIDKTDSGETDKSAKKPKTETPTPPLQITNEPNLQNVSPNPMLNQSTVSVSSKQQAVQQQQQQQQQATTLSSGITSHIRAPILKDIVDTRLRSNSPYNSSSSSSMVGSGTSTPSLYVSVPLSTATVPGVNLPSTTNVSDQISQSQLSRSSPVVNHHHAHSHHHQSNLMSNSQQQPVIERQSPRVHLSSSVALNSSNTSASSSSGGHNIEQSLSSGSSQLSSGAIIQSSNSPAPNHSMTNYAGAAASVSTMESGGLKITYEKQNPRVSQLQEEQHHGPVRRSRTPDSGNFSNTNSSSIASSNAMMGISSSSTGSGSIGNLNSSGSSGSGSIGGLGRGSSAGGGSGAGDSGGGLKFCYESQTSSAIQPISPPAAVASSQPPVVKESPPSSPGSEAGSARKRGRKSVESKDIKLFHNGVHATHMLGNQLNPASSVAQKMSDQLHMEIEAHSVYAQPNIDTGPPLVGIPFPGKQSSTRSSSQSSGSNSLTSMLGGSNTTSGSGNTPQSLEQLLERQWEQGSQFLMEQAQHFDIASLLSCLHQLRTENVRLEEHVNNLVARRDHLLAVNARLAIPLNPNVQQQSQAPLNALHMNGPTTETSAAASLASSRISRTNTHFSGQQQVPVENGIDYRHSSHSTSGSSQATISHN